jgi:hypothetical protein
MPAAVAGDPAVVLQETQDLGVPERGRMEPQRSSFGLTGRSLSQDGFGRR